MLQSVPDTLKALRVHHWVKNTLIFSPILLSHQVANAEAWLQSLVAFFAFSFAASGVYIINDLLDVSSDRAHPYKKARPIAAGALSANFGKGTAAVLVTLALTIGFALNFGVAVLILAYLCLNVAYSGGLKQVMFLDVLLLAGFYVLRIFTGSIASGIAVSPWFLAFSLFLFLSLALVKRTSELVRIRNEGGNSDGNCYESADLSLLFSFGASSGYLAVLVLALYLNGSFVQSLYLYPHMLWGICPVLLYWLSRLWLLAGRGANVSDPIVFAFTDRISYLTALLVIAIWCSAWGILPLPFLNSIHAGLGN